jgi:hypothetical protein
MNSCMNSVSQLGAFLVEKIPKFEVDGFERRRVKWFFVRPEFVGGLRSG